MCNHVLKLLYAKPINVFWATWKTSVQATVEPPNIWFDYEDYELEPNRKTLKVLKLELIIVLIVSINSLFNQCGVRWLRTNFFISLLVTSTICYKTD